MASNPWWSKWRNCVHFGQNHECLAITRPLRFLIVMLEGKFNRSLRYEILSKVDSVAAWRVVIGVPSSAEILIHFHLSEFTEWLPATSCHTAARWRKLTYQYSGAEKRVALVCWSAINSHQIMITHRWQIKPRRNCKHLDSKEKTSLRCTASFNQITPPLDLLYWKRLK